MFFCIHFPAWPPKKWLKKIFYTGKLYGLTGMLYTDEKSVPKDMIWCATEAEGLWE